MKTKVYKIGKTTCKAYLKPVGIGYEVGLVQGKKPLFLGNFIHSAEANKWYSLMNIEIKKFVTKYKVAKAFPVAWFNKFLSHHLYNRYYNLVGTLVNKNVRPHKSGFGVTLRKYKKLNRIWKNKGEKRLPATKAA